jgi:serine/threonine protein kinase
MPPESFGKYKVVRLLGKGGMATVYEGHDTLLDRKVAIKTIHPYLVDDEKFLRRFRQEAKLLASLRHPHIVHFLDFDQFGTQLCLVMEYLEGGSLSNRLANLRTRNELMPECDMLQILDAVAAGLDYAHRHGMIHRDIKPANILFASDGTPVVTDFGITKSLVESLSISATGSILGTPAYMSPEQASGAHVDSSTDIYSLGIMVYELVTGRVPFQGNSATEVLLKHIQQKPPEPTKFNPKITKPVQDVILKALAKDPANRFSTATEFARAVRSALQSDSPVFNQPSTEGETEIISPEMKLAELSTIVDGKENPKEDQPAIEIQEKKASPYSPPPLPKLFKSLRLSRNKKEITPPPIQPAKPIVRTDPKKKRNAIILWVSLGILLFILACVFIIYLPEINESLKQYNESSTTTTYSFSPKITMTPAAYTTVSDASGKISAPVPIEWNDIDPQASLFNDSVLLTQEELIAAPDIVTFQVIGGESGTMLATVNSTLSLDKQLDQFIPLLGGLCERIGRDKYKRSGFKGYYDTYEQCGEGKTTQIVLSAQEDIPGSVPVLIIVQAKSVADFKAAEKIFDEFTVETTE